jgi:cytochrome c-type biogenesis protein CcmH
MRRQLGLCVLLLAAFANAAIETYEFATEDQRQRYLDFTRELRCPKCQNQNLADSNSPIAADLRRELYRLLEEGKNDDEIVDFMVQRYGDYVLYRPPLERRTWFLWLAPLMMLAGGLIVLAGIVLRARRRAALTAGAPDRDLSEQERRRLDELLGPDRNSL